MRIGIVGAGVSGLTAAWQLAPHHDVSVFEADHRAGGHTHTHAVQVASQEYRVDSGFIVFNQPNYPNFCQLLDRLEVTSQVSDMSFAVRNDVSGLEYNATSVSGLFARPANAVQPRFWQMLRDIRRFYREAPALLSSHDGGPTTGDYLDQAGYSPAFAEEHLIPMASALWSAPPRQILEFPIGYMVRFFANHRMLQVSGRPDWRVVTGGSDQYVQRLLAGLDASVHLSTPVTLIQRRDDGVVVSTATGERFECDAVILSCHADQALAMLADPSPEELSILGAFPYQRNDVVLHTDTRLLPRRRRAWAAWNTLVSDQPDAPCTVSYDMNILQGIQAPVEFVVTLNCNERIDPDKIIDTMVYHHPVYTRESVAAQGQRDQINGSNNTWYCGAYWGWGFHEDGVSSALHVVDQLQREPAHA